MKGIEDTRSEIKWLYRLKVYLQSFDLIGFVSGVRAGLPSAQRPVPADGKYLVKYWKIRRNLLY